MQGTVQPDAIVGLSAEGSHPAAASAQLPKSGVHSWVADHVQPAEDSSSDEDTSDEAFAACHAPWEWEERNRFLSHSAGPTVFLQTKPQAPHWTGH